jgi:hypothetical protein
MFTTIIYLYENFIMYNLMPKFIISMNFYLRYKNITNCILNTTLYIK